MNRRPKVTLKPRAAVGAGVSSLVTCRRMVQAEGRTRTKVLRQKWVWCVGNSRDLDSQLGAGAEKRR